MLGHPDAAATPICASFSAGALTCLPAGLTCLPVALTCVPAASFPQPPGVSQNQGGQPAPLCLPSILGFHGPPSERNRFPPVPPAPRAWFRLKLWTANPQVRKSRPLLRRGDLKHLLHQVVPSRDGRSSVPALVPSSPWVSRDIRGRCPMRCKDPSGAVAASPFPLRGKHSACFEPLLLFP